MTAFDEMISDIYADDDFALDGLFHPQGGAGIPVRLMKREPESLVIAGAGRAVVSGLAFSVRQSEVPNQPRQGDAISQVETADGPATIYDVEDSVADGQRLEWLLSVTKR